MFELFDPLNEDRFLLFNTHIGQRDILKFKEVTKLWAIRHDPPPDGCHFVSQALLNALKIIVFVIEVSQGEHYFLFSRRVRAHNPLVYLEDYFQQS
jgi:hypothetical protein